MNTKDSNLTKTLKENADSAIGSVKDKVKDTIGDLTDGVRDGGKVMSDAAQSAKVDSETTTQNFTEKFESDVNDSEHVNDGDNPARQPDRRDQQGSTAFDDNINDDTMATTGKKSDEITDANRYASVENAQTRTLNPDLKNESYDNKDIL